ncbi:MAG: PDZ domain-containing protein [Planctomycetota bacterium]
MRRIAYVLAAVAAFGAVTAPRLFAGDPPAATPEEQAQIARLVEDLGSADFRVREAATKALIEFGAKARPALEKAVQSDNPAVRFRADQLLQGLDGTKGERKLGEDARPARPQGPAGGSTRDDVQRSIEQSRREMEQALREMREKWGSGRFDEQMKDMEKQLREFQEQMDKQFGGFGVPGPNVRVMPNWLEPWAARTRLARGIEVATEAEGTTLTLSDRPNRVKLEVRSTKDRSAVATFTASSVDALFAAYPALRTWPGVAQLLEKHAAAKAERAKAEEDARKQAETAPPAPHATNRSVAIESTDGHVKVTIAETGPDGKQVTKTYEGADLETLKAQHPELREALGGFSMHFGPGTTFGPGTGFGPGGPFGPGAGPRPLEEDDGDDDADEPARGAPQTGPFGLALGDVDDDLRSHLGLAEGQGAYVVFVREGSDASKLGLQAKDVIVRVNDTVVKALADVGTAVRAVPDGGALTMEVLRAGKPVTLKR